VARMKKADKEKASQTAESESSGIGAMLEKEMDKVTGPLTASYEGTATTSEIACECSQAQREDQLREFHGTQEY
jgi:hypothetical protein